MRKTTISDIMTTNVITAKADTTFKRLAEVFAGQEIGAVPVIDQSRRVVGVVSETDLLKATAGIEVPWVKGALGLRRSRSGSGTPRTAATLMSEPAITIRPDAALNEAARLMTQRKVTHLPVVDGENKLVGIVGRSDILGVFLATDEHLKNFIEYEIIEQTMWINPQLVTVEVKDGVVTLAGQVERKSLIPITVQLTSMADGVVSVIDHLTYNMDDTEISPFPPRSAFPH